MLRSSGQITLDDFKVPQQHRRRLKLLVALSSLLVRDHETVAVMAKTNGSGTTLILSSNPKEAADVTGLDIPDDESPASSRFHQSLVTRNPPFGSQTIPVQLMLLGNPDVGSDVHISQVPKLTNVF